MLAIFWLFFLRLESAESHNCSLEDNDTLRCVTKLPELARRELPHSLRTVELVAMDQKELDLHHLVREFPEIQNVSIYDGNVSRIKSPTKRNNITVLQLVRVGVENIGNKFLGNFPKLETLNLQGNYLQSLAELSVGHLKHLYLSGNRWNCSMDLEWVLRLNKSVVDDLANLTCFGEPHSNKKLTTIARFTQELQKQCPSYCSCSLPKVVHKKIGSLHLEPIIEVNCSSRGLTELPLDLPPKTRIIHLEDNQIEDLNPIKYEQVYRKAFDLYLDNNDVKTIEELEGSYFLRHFRVFSLSGNKLSEVPTYALDNALDQNMHALALSLGGNPWRCDCVFTPVFQLQEMLQKFAAQIPDLREVTCSYVEGDENSFLPIIELSRSSVCRSPTEYSVQALDLLNGVLASLILLILGKLAYDYYYFKKTGRLPWIVTKMP